MITLNSLPIAVSSTIIANQYNFTVNQVKIANGKTLRGLILNVRYESGYEYKVTG